MTSAQGLVDEFAAQVAAHAKLPTGSAAAASAAEQVAVTRLLLLYRMRDEAVELARLRRTVRGVRDLVTAVEL